MSRHKLKLDFTDVYDALLEMETVEGATWFLPHHKTKLLNGSDNFDGVNGSGTSDEEIALTIKDKMGRKTSGAVSVGDALELAGVSFAELEKSLANQAAEAV